MSPDRGRQPNERPGEDVGDDEVEGTVAPEDRRAKTGRDHRGDQAAGAVQLRVDCGNPRGDRIDVARQHRRAHEPRDRNREDPGAGADV
jgi:hypothetical protein